MINYYVVIQGSRNVYIDDARKGNFIGADLFPDLDLTGKLGDKWQEFNKQMIPVYLDRNPDKSKISAGRDCGMLWMITKGILEGDIILSPDGKGGYYTGEVASSYKYLENQILPHRRDVRWLDKTISRSDMTQSLQRSIRSVTTASTLTKHGNEIEALLNNSPQRVIASTEQIVEDTTVFALEKHLEDFLIENWRTTELDKSYDIFEENGELAGQQYETDTGPLDILAVSKDKKEIAVIELKKGRIGDVVVGQVQRYMGYVKEQLLEPNQTVRGIIVALEDDFKLRRALSVTQNIDFYIYKIQFKLEKQ